MFLFIILAGCIATPSDDPVDVFEYTWDTFDQRYGGFEQRDIDWDAAYDTWRPQVDHDSSEDELYDALSGLIQTLDDGHVRLIAADREVVESNRDYRERTMEGTFDDAVVRTYLTDPDTGPWDWYLRGEVAPDVHYVWFPGIDDNTWVLEDIVEAQPSSLIIDLRHSHGGAFTYALRGLRPLFAEETPYTRVRSRNGPDRSDFDEWFTWTQPAADDPWPGPVFVLTDRETISASERILLALHERPNTVFIGVPSNGALATSVGAELPNGWYLQHPVQETTAMDGTVYEGVGLPVDIEMLNDPKEVASGRDRVLEYAIEQAAAAR